MAEQMIKIPRIWFVRTDILCCENIVKLNPETFMKPAKLVLSTFEEITGETGPSIGARRPRCLQKLASRAQTAKPSVQLIAGLQGKPFSKQTVSEGEHIWIQHIRMAGLNRAFNLQNREGKSAATCCFIRPQQHLKPVPDACLPVNQGAVAIKGQCCLAADIHYVSPFSSLVALPVLFKNRKKPGKISQLRFSFRNVNMNKQRFQDFRYRRRV